LVKDADLRVEASVTATDVNGNSATASAETTDGTFIVDTTPPELPANQRFEYSENQTDIATPIATVSFSVDQNESAPTFAFEDSGTNISQDGLFTINSKGEVFLTNLNSEANDFEAGDIAHKYTITATDSANNTNSTEITLTEKNVNEAPVAENDTTATIAGLSGEYWGYVEGGTATNLTTINQVTTYIDNTDAEIEFISTEINYHYGSGDLADDIDENGVPSHLTNFLGGDATSIETINGGSTQSATDAIIKMTGNLHLETAGDYTFNVRHDDGFQIKIDGTDVFNFDGITPALNSSQTITLTAGSHTVELYYWDQGGGYVLELTLDDLNNNNIWLAENLSHTVGGNAVPVEEDSTTGVVIDVLSNDSDPDGDTLNITHVQGHDFSNDGPVAMVTNDAGIVIGTAVIQVIDGVDNIKFTPDPSLQSLAEGEELSVSFEYSITDNNGGTDSAIAYITVHGLDDPTITKTDYYRTTEDKTLSVAAAQGVLSNDIDVDNVLTVTTFTVEGDTYIAGSSVTIVGKGELTLNSDGSYEFVPFTNYSGTIPTVTYTTNTGGTDTLYLSVIPVADPVDANEFSAEVGTLNVIDIVLGDTSNTIVTTDDGHSSGNIISIEYPDGTIITPGGNDYLYTSSGQGLGIGQGGDFRIDEGDSLNVDLPNYVTDLGLVFKNASGQTITFTMQNIDGTTSTQIYTFDEKGNADSTMTLSSDKPFGEFSFVVTGETNGGNGSTLIGLTTLGVVQSSYNYPLDLAYGFTDTDGSESVTSITLSGFPVGTDINIYEGDEDGVQEVFDNGDGTWTIDVTAFTQEGSTFSLADLVIQTDIELPSGFDPRLELNVVDGYDNSVSILGGSESELLQGTDSGDLLNGESGNDELIGGLGDDLLIGGLGDDLLTGGEGADTFVWLEGDSGTDHVKDFNFAEGDVLDLSDLLQLSIGDNLDDYLDFKSDGTNTTIEIHANADTDITQTIILDGVDLGSDDVTIINDMLTGEHQGGLFIGDDISVNSVTMEVIPDDQP